MSYPIIAYGAPILRQKALAIEKGTPMQPLVQAMFTTMDRAQGVGLAAPQIGQSIRLFIVNLAAYLQEKGRGGTGRKVFINPVLTVDDGIAPSTCQEGCLSIPSLLIPVPRREKITIHYFNTQWQWQKEVWTGFPARVMQHEYDHLEGKLHIDYAPPLRKRLLQKPLAKIRQGQVDVPYPMHFA